VHPVEELHVLLPEADVVFLIAPHTPQTEGLIGARELALLPDGALLVNVAPPTEVAAAGTSRCESSRPSPRALAAVVSATASATAADARRIRVASPSLASAAFSTARICSTEYA